MHALSAQLHSSSRTPSQKLRRRHRDRSGRDRIDVAATYGQSFDHPGARSIDRDHHFAGSVEEGQPFVHFVFCSVAVPGRDENQLILCREIIEFGEVNLALIPYFHSLARVIGSAAVTELS
jgi:hypothetical protein